jgi:hypothetical protein
VIAGAVIVLGGVAAYFLLRRVARRRWRLVRACGDTRHPGRGVDGDGVAASDAAPGPPPSEVSRGHRGARARRAMWTAIEDARRRWKHADGRDAPVAELPAVCRSLRRVGGELDQLLRLERRLPAGQAAPTCRARPGGRGDRRRPRRAVGRSAGLRATPRRRRSMPWFVRRAMRSRSWAPRCRGCGRSPRTDPSGSSHADVKLGPTCQAVRPCLPPARATPHAPSVRARRRHILSSARASPSAWPRRATRSRVGTTATGSPPTIGPPGSAPAGWSAPAWPATSGPTPKRRWTGPPPSGATRSASRSSGPGSSPSPAASTRPRWSATSRSSRCAPTRGLEPIVTLHHFTHPSGWARSSGCARGRRTVFARHVQRVLPALAPHCRRWVTINEPNIVMLMGWIEGAHPAGRRLAFADAFCVLDNLLTAHVLAADVIVAVQPEAEVTCNTSSSSIYEHDRMLTDLLLLRSAGVPPSDVDRYIDERRALHDAAFPPQHAGEFALRRFFAALSPYGTDRGAGGGPPGPNCAAPGGRAAAGRRCRATPRRSRAAWAPSASTGTTRLPATPCACRGGGSRRVSATGRSGGPSGTSPSHPAGCAPGAGPSPRCARGLPLWVVENGMATRRGRATAPFPREDGWDRPRYIREHLAAVVDAVAEGVPGHGLPALVPGRQLRVGHLRAALRDLRHGPSDPSGPCAGWTPMPRATTRPAPSPASCVAWWRGPVGARRAEGRPADGLSRLTAAANRITRSASASSDRSRRRRRRMTRTTMTTTMRPSSTSDATPERAPPWCRRGPRSSRAGSRPFPR